VTSDDSKTRPDNVVPFRTLSTEELADADRLRRLVNHLLKEATPKDGSPRELSLSVLALQFACTAVLHSLDYSKEEALLSFERAWVFNERQVKT
jgi:hypothetical protein